LTDREAVHTGTGHPAAQDVGQLKETFMEIRPRCTGGQEILYLGPTKY